MNSQWTRAHNLNIGIFDLRIWNLNQNKLICKDMIIIQNVIILKRGIVYALNERKRQLHFEGCHTVSLSMLFLGLVYVRRT